MNTDAGQVPYSTPSALFLYETRSLCPICLQSLPARIERRGDAVFLSRDCPEHGPFSGLIWKGEPDFAFWKRPKQDCPPSAGAQNSVERTNRGCPGDCGPCFGHTQSPCTVLFEITRYCNLNCPVCFASALPAEAGMEMENAGELKERLRRIRALAGEVVLQFSGGEPTLHPDLPELVREANGLFPAVQLNSNGLLLAEKPDLARALAAAGLSWVFLQFDGTRDDIYTRLRGRPLLDIKLAALRNCREANLPVVLVPTLAKGVNDQDLGNILRLGLSLAPGVRGLHLQPMTISGRNLPCLIGGEDLDLTLPETLQAICAQSGGLMRPEHASPPGCEHERCSFHCRYRLTPTGQLVPMRDTGGDCCPAPGKTGCCTLGNAEESGKSREETGRVLSDRPGARRAVDLVGMVWSAPDHSPADKEKIDAFDAFIAEARAQVFSVTCMAFQDCRTVDLERLRGCCVFVYAHPDRLVPFCAYNMSGLDGRSLHR